MILALAINENFRQDVPEKKNIFQLRFSHFFANNHVAFLVMYTKKEIGSRHC